MKPFTPIEARGSASMFVKEFTGGKTPARIVVISTARKIRGERVSIRTTSERPTPRGVANQIFLDRVKERLPGQPYFP